MSNEGEMVERHSRALTPTLITDPVERAERESLNGLAQARVLYDMIDEWLQPERRFRLRPSMVLQLHRAAVDGLTAFAGNYRPAGVQIEGSRHAPVGAHLVPEKIEEMCDYVNEHWTTATAIHLSSYVMWRLNWIHPFDDGNGRTSRAVSYLVLCMKLGYRPSGRVTIPERIVQCRGPYYRALEAADEAYSNAQIDLSVMEALLRDLLSAQLLDVVKEAAGGDIGD